MSLRPCSLTFVRRRQDQINVQLHLPDLNINEEGRGTRRTQSTNLECSISQSARPALLHPGHPRRFWGVIHL